MLFKEMCFIVLDSFHSAVVVWFRTNSTRSKYCLTTLSRVFWLHDSPLTIEVSRYTDMCAVFICCHQGNRSRNPQKCHYQLCDLLKRCRHKNNEVGFFFLNLTKTPNTKRFKNGVTVCYVSVVGATASEAQYWKRRLGWGGGGDWAGIWRLGRGGEY